MYIQGLSNRLHCPGIFQPSVLTPSFQRSKYLECLNVIGFRAQFESIEIVIGGIRHYLHCFS